MNIGGWEYDYETLPGWEVHDRLPWCSDQMACSPESDTACLVYSIGEVRIGTEMGYLAVLKGKSAPKLLVSVTSLMFPIQEPFYSRDGRYIILKAQLYIEAERRVECPILFLDVVEKKFANFRMRGNNYSYRFEELSPSRYLVQVDEYQKKEGYAEDRIAEIADFVWFPLDRIENREQWRTIAPIG